MQIIEYRHSITENYEITIFTIDGQLPGLIAKGLSVIIDGQIYPVLFDIKRHDWFAVKGIVTPKNNEIEFTNV